MRRLNVVHLRAAMAVLADVTRDTVVRPMLYLVSGLSVLGCAVAFAADQQATGIAGAIAAQSGPAEPAVLEALETLRLLAGLGMVVVAVVSNLIGAGVVAAVALYRLKRVEIESASSALRLNQVERDVAFMRGRHGGD